VYVQGQILIRITYYIFIKNKKYVFLNSKTTDDAAFSCSMHRGVYVCCDIKYGFMVLRFRNDTIQDCFELLLTLMIMQVTNIPNVGKLSY